MIKVAFVLYLAMLGWLLLILIQDKPIKTEYWGTGECIDFSTKHDCDDPPKDYHTVYILR